MCTGKSLLPQFLPSPLPCSVPWAKGVNFFYGQRQQTDFVQYHPIPQTFLHKGFCSICRGDTLVNLKTHLWTAELIQPIFLWLS